MANRRKQENTQHAKQNVPALLEALPYIRAFSGKPIVIKYGGAAMTDEHLREGFAQQIALMKYVGINPIIVHGGGGEITEYMTRFGLETNFVDGLRVTNAEAVKIAKMVLVGKINKEIVGRINRHGQTAIGFCGDDGRLFRTTKRLSGRKDIGFVGKVDQVNTKLLLQVAEDYIAVVAPAGSDDSGQPFNVNADEAAGAIAKAIMAHKIIFLTDVDGWRQDPDDADTLIGQATVAEVEAALDDVSGGMRPKLQACVQAIKGGADAAHIVDGRVPNSLIAELFTDTGVGTKIFP